MERYRLEEGDLVLGMDRPLITGGLRAAAVTSSDLPALLVQRVIRLRANSSATNEFLRFALRSRAFQDLITPITTGVSVPHISEDQVASFRVPLRSREEQLEAVRILGEAEQNSNKLISDLRRQAELLGEHRRALITAAVTGELAIPGVAA
jgi:type I restriction enzyme S subunit